MSENHGVNQREILPTFHCTIPPSASKKTYAAKSLAVTCACARAIWEFPTPYDDPVIVATVLFRVNDLPRHPWKTSGSLQRHDWRLGRGLPWKSRPALTNLQHADWTLNEQRSSHQLARVMWLGTSWEKQKWKTLVWLVGLGPPTAAQSGAPSLFIVLTGVKAGMEWITVPEHSSVIIPRRK